MKMDYRARSHNDDSLPKDERWQIKRMECREEPRGAINSGPGCALVPYKRDNRLDVQNKMRRMMYVL